MRLSKSTLREETERWLLEIANVKSMKDGLFITLTIPPKSISPYMKNNGFIDMSKREVCISMLRNLKNRIKKSFIVVAVGGVGSFRLLRGMEKIKNSTFI